MPVVAPSPGDQSGLIPCAGSGGVHGHDPQSQWRTMLHPSPVNDSPGQQGTGQVVKYLCVKLLPA